MKREIRDKRNDLREGSKRLQELAWNEELRSKKGFELREKQEEQFKKFKFYDGMIKAADKVKEEKWKKKKEKKK